MCWTTVALPTAFQRVSVRCKPDRLAVKAEPLEAFLSRSRSRPETSHLTSRLYREIIESGRQKWTRGGLMLLAKSAISWSNAGGK